MGLKQIAIYVLKIFTTNLQNDRLELYLLLVTTECYTFLGKNESTDGVGKERDTRCRRFFAVVRVGVGED